MRDLMQWDEAESLMLHDIAENGLDMAEPEVTVLGEPCTWSSATDASAVPFSAVMEEAADTCIAAAVVGAHHHVGSEFQSLRLYMIDVSTAGARSGKRLTAQLLVYGEAALGLSQTFERASIHAPVFALWYRTRWRGDALFMSTGPHDFHCLEAGTEGLLAGLQGRLCQALPQPGLMVSDFVTWSQSKERRPVRGSIGGLVSMCAVSESHVYVELLDSQGTTITVCMAPADVHRGALCVGDAVVFVGLQGSRRHRCSLSWVAGLSMLLVRARSDPNARLQWLGADPSSAYQGTEWAVCGPHPDMPAEPAASRVYILAPSLPTCPLITQLGMRAAASQLLLRSCNVGRASFPALVYTSQRRERDIADIHTLTNAQIVGGCDATPNIFIDSDLRAVVLRSVAIHPNFGPMRFTCDAENTLLAAAGAAPSSASAGAAPSSAPVGAAPSSAPAGAAPSSADSTAPCFYRSTYNHTVHAWTCHDYDGALVHVCTGVRMGLNLCATFVHQGISPDVLGGVSLSAASVDTVLAGDFSASDWASAGADEGARLLELLNTRLAGQLWNATIRAKRSTGAIGKFGDARRFSNYTCVHIEPRLP